MTIIGFIKILRPPVSDIGMTEVMKRLRKWFISLMLIVITLIVLKMADDIWWIPDYRGGEGYAGCSPDGRYKAMLIHPLDYNANSVQIIMEQNHSAPISIIRMPNDWIFTHFFWSCNKDSFFKCTEFTKFKLSYAVTVSLPPTLWQRLHAWLTVKIRGLENPNLTVDYDDDYMGYCEKYWP